MALTDKLTAIANAIREKTGKTEKLSLDEMPTAIKSIQGASGDGKDTLIDYLLGNPTRIISDEITIINNVKISGTHVKEITLPNLHTISDSLLIYNTGVTTLDFPKLEKMKSNSIKVNQNLVSINFPAFVGSTGYQEGFGIAASYSLKTVNLPKLQYLDKEGFDSSRNLERLDFPSLIQINNVSYQHPFYNCNRLTILILRANQVVKLVDSTKLFENCPINNGGYNNKQGYIYVPKALLEDYKVATNWSVYAEKFRAIEDYPEICGDAK